MFKARLESAQKIVNQIKPFSSLQSPSLQAALGISADYTQYRPCYSHQRPTSSISNSLHTLSRQRSPPIFLCSSLCTTYLYTAWTRRSCRLQSRTLPSSHFSAATYLNRAQWPTPVNAVNNAPPPTALSRMQSTQRGILRRPLVRHCPHFDISMSCCLERCIDLRWNN